MKLQSPGTHKSTSISRKPRTGRTKERALATAAAILRREGYSRLTMERVTAESGIAKTTLYRRWPTRAALCVDLYLEVAGRELNEPDTCDVASDLRAVVQEVVRLQTSKVAGAAFRGLIAEAQLDPNRCAPLLAEFARQRRPLTRRVLERAVERRQIRADVDIDLVIDVLGGAATFRLLQGHAPLSRKFADELVKLVLFGCAARPGKHGKKERR